MRSRVCGYGHGGCGKSEPHMMRSSPISWRRFAEELEERPWNLSALVGPVVGERVTHTAGDDVQRHRYPRFFGDGPKRIVNRAAVRSRALDRLRGHHDASRAPPDDAFRLID